MDDEPTRRSDGRAHAAQAGLAALVAASLLAFSFIAFRTGLTGDNGPGVTARRLTAGAARPVLLPASPRPAVAPAQASPDTSVALTTNDDDDVVLGTSQLRTPEERIDPGGEPPRGRARATDKRTGHEKARGQGHHKNEHNGRHDETDSDWSSASAHDDDRDHDDDGRERDHDDDAPERDHDDDAPERDHDDDAPERDHGDDAPERDHGDDAPERDHDKGRSGSRGPERSKGWSGRSHGGDNSHDDESQNDGRRKGRGKHGR